MATITDKIKARKAEGLTWEEWSAQMAAKNATGSAAMEMYENDAYREELRLAREAKIGGHEAKAMKDAGKLGKKKKSKKDKKKKKKKKKKSKKKKSKKDSDSDSDSDSSDSSSDSDSSSGKKKKKKKKGKKKKEKKEKKSKKSPKKREKKKKVEGMSVRAMMQQADSEDEEAIDVDKVFGAE